MDRKEKLEIEVEVPANQLHVNHVYCGNGHSLCDPAKKVSGYPAIRLDIKYQGKTGILYLDPVYGSHNNIEEGIEIPEGAIAELFCPECGENLTAAEEKCQLCASPMFQLILPKGGIIEGCLKKGCYFHKMKIVDKEQQIARLYENDTLESYL